MKPLKILLTINVEALDASLKTSGKVETTETKVAEAVKETVTEQTVSSKIAHQNLSVRAKNALMNNGIKTLRTLSKRTEEEISNIRGIGKTVLAEILELKGTLEPVETTAKSTAPSKGKQEITGLNLSTRCENALIKAGIQYVEELQKLSDEELQNLKGVGATVMKEINSIRGNSVAPETTSEFSDMSLSKRASNILKNSNITSLDQLSKLTDDELRGMKGVGATVFNEFLSIIGREEAKPSTAKDSLANLELSKRTFNALTKAGITTVAELLDYTDSEIAGFKGVGATVMEEVSAIRALSQDVKEDTSTRHTPKAEAKVKAGDKHVLESLELSTRAYNALSNAGIKYVEDLQTMSHSELNELKGVGATIIEELDNTLKNYSQSSGANNSKMHDIHDLNLSTRCENALVNAGINFVEDINKMSDNELRSTKGIGENAVKQIRESIHQMPMVANA